MKKSLNTLGCTIFLITLFSLNCLGETKLENLAKLKGISYDLSSGSYWANHSTDDYNLKLQDGIYDSGDQYTVCYDFFRQPDEERYVSIDFDLKKVYEIKNVVLWAKNLNENFNVKSVYFYVSNDGIDFDELGKLPESGGEIKQPVLGSFSIEQAVNKQVRFLRVVAFTRYIINLEELEIFGFNK